MTTSITSMRRSLELLPLLLLVMLAVWPPPAAQAIFPLLPHCEEEPRWWCVRMPRRPPPHRAPPPPLPSVNECVGPIRSVKGCEDSLFRSDTSGVLRVEPECCGAVRSMKGRCFDAFFTSVYFRSDFAPKLKEHCTKPATPPATPPATH